MNIKKGYIIGLQSDLSAFLASIVIATEDGYSLPPGLSYWEGVHKLIESTDCPGGEYMFDTTSEKVVCVHIHEYAENYIELARNHSGLTVLVTCTLDELRELRPDFFDHNNRIPY